MIKAVVFDMDGVLIEAKDWHFEALNQALRLFGFEIGRYDHLATFDGLPTKRKLQILSADGALPIELHNFINEMKQRYTMEIVAAKCKPRFVHEYALSRLRAEGYRMAVASNSIRSTIETMMRQADLSQYMDFMVSNEDVTQAKPDPEMYQKAFARLALNPSQVLIVEDSENGVRAARASGAHILQVDEVDEVNYTAIARRIAECNLLNALPKAG